MHTLARVQKGYYKRFGVGIHSTVDSTLQTFHYHTDYSNACSSIHLVPSFLPYFLLLQKGNHDNYTTVLPINLAMKLCPYFYMILLYFKKGTCLCGKIIMSTVQHNTTVSLQFSTADTIRFLVKYTSDQSGQRKTTKLLTSILSTLTHRTYTQKGSYKTTKHNHNDAH